MGKPRKKKLHTAGGVYEWKGLIYSISAKNEKGQFVVVKLKMVDGSPEELDSVIIKATTTKGVQNKIASIPWENFEKFRNTLH